MCIGLKYSANTRRLPVLARTHSAQKNLPSITTSVYFLSQDGDDEEEREAEAEYSPPLFIQFVLSISQVQICTAVKRFENTI